MKKYIQAFKYEGITGLSNSMASFMNSHLKRYWPTKKIDIVTAVPLHPLKQKERGFNQSHLLAKSISKKLELPYKTLLYRTRNTFAQSKIKKEKREVNVKNAFNYFSMSSVENKSILIVDDILTSGATFQECAKSLIEKAKVKNVYLLTLASVVSDN